MFRIREAKEADNEALLSLEATCPQGRGIKILIEREDYFYRTSLFNQGKVMLAEEDGRLVGVMAYAIKDVFFGGEEVCAAYLYDLRGEAAYRRSMKRGLYRLWKAVESEVVAEGAALLYGHVKADNTDARRIAAKSSAQSVGTFGVLVLPVLPRGPRHPRVLAIPTEQAVAEVEARAGKRDLQPTRLHNLYTRGERLGFLKGVYRVEERGSFAQISVWDLSKVYRGTALHIPAGLCLTRVGLAPLIRVLPLPRIPRVGETLSYWHLFDPIALGAKGPRLLFRLVRELRHLAAGQGIDIVNLAAYLDPLDVPFPQVFPSVLLTYHTFVKRIDPYLPNGPLYLDVRDI